MPELPEVEALAVFLREHAKGRVVARADAASFAVLKTFDPPLSALTGRSITDVGRHGKFLDLTASGPDGDLHLVFHLARAGWLRWREDIPDKPVKPGKSPLAFRLVLDDGAGFDLTEAGTQKRLAVYLVRDVADVPGVATLGPEPLADDFDVDALAAILKGRRTQIKGVLRDQHIIAGIGNAYSDEVLHAAKMSPFKLASSFTPDEVATLHARDRDHAPRRGEALGGTGGGRSQGREEDRTARARQDWSALPGLRGHDPRGLLRRLLAPVLPYLPDRRQAPSRPSAFPPAQVISMQGTAPAVVPPRRASRLAAVREVPSPHRADEVHDPYRDVSAGRPTALVHRTSTLTPDNAHQIPLRPRGIAAAPVARPPGGVGRLAARLRVSPVTPRNPERPRRYLAE